MHRLQMIAWAAACVLMTTACAKKEAEAPAAPAVDLVAEAQAVRDRSAEWMKFAQAKDAAGVVANIITADSVVIYDGAMHRGTAEIQADMEQDIAAAPNSVVSWTTDDVRVAAAGDMAYELGTTTFDPDGDGAAPPETVKYVTIWLKGEGQWRAVVDAGTTIKPAEAAAAGG